MGVGIGGSCPSYCKTGGDLTASHALAGDYPLSATITCVPGDPNKSGSEAEPFLQIGICRNQDPWPNDDGGVRVARLGTAVRGDRLARCHLGVQAPDHQRPFDWCAGFSKQPSPDLDQPESVADAHHVDYCWRLLIGVGAVPGAVALYFRLTLPETPRFTMDVERNIKQASSDVDAFLSSGAQSHDHEVGYVKADAPVATRRDFFAYFKKWENGKLFLGCAYSWFALDVKILELGLVGRPALTRSRLGRVLRTR